MAYTNATVTQANQEADGRIHLVVTYSGAGEQDLNKSIYINETSDIPSIVLRVRSQAMDEIARINSSDALFTTVENALPYALDVTTPIPSPPASTFGAFTAASAPFTPGATPQDVFTISGSATKTVTVVGAGISTVQTTAGSNWWHLIRRANANTGGTSTAVSGIPTLLSYPAATANVLQYTANPTLGSPNGRVWAGRVPSPAPATSGIGNANIEVGGVLSRQGLQLVGVGDTLAFNFNGVALPAGLSVVAWFSWTES